MDTGNAAEWANVVVTAFALGAAGWAAWSTHTSLQLERDREAKREMAEQASQAALIAAWGGRAPTGKPTTHWRGSVQNSSNVPVYNVVVILTSPERPGAEETHDVGVLPPGRATFPYPSAWCKASATPGYPPVMTVSQVDVTVMFTDATGIVWQRNRRGELSQVYGHDSMAFLQRTVWPNSAAGRP